MEIAVVESSAGAKTVSAGISETTAGAAGGPRGPVSFQRVRA